MATGFHSPLFRLKREMEIRREADPQGLYRCKYCPAPGRSYQTIKSLERHVRESSESNAGASHDAAKSADGWYDEGFYPEERRRRAAVIAEAEEQSDVGFRVVIPSTIEPHPTDPRIAYGHTETPPEQQRFIVTNMLSAFDDSLPARPPHPLIIVGPVPTGPLFVEERYRHLITTIDLTVPPLSRRRGRRRRAAREEE